MECVGSAMLEFVHLNLMRDVTRNDDLSSIRLDILK